jgi:hypothetical protein
MKHYYYFFSFILLLPFLSKAQSNYKPGYVVTLSGDTLKGYIDYREWEINPKQFSFKKDQGAAVEKYNINTCNAFDINGFEYFQKYIVSVSQNPVDPVVITASSDTSSIIDTVFLSIVTKGKRLNLYRLTDHIKNHIYIAENNQHPVELLLRLHLDADDDNKVITQTIYKNQLHRIAYAWQPDNKILEAEIDDANYDIKDISKIVNKINGQGNYIQNEAVNMNGVVLFAGIGVVNTQTKFTGNFDYSGQSHNVIFPLIDLGVDFLRNKNIGSLIIRVELGFTGNKAHFTQTKPGNLTTPDVSNLSFNQYTAYLNPQLLYNFYNTKTLKVYTAVGIIANYSAYTNKSYTIAFGGSSPTDLTPYVFPDLTSLYFSLSGKVGIELNNKIDIHIGYWLPTNINNNIGYSVKTSQYALGINYKFGSK